MLDLAGQSAHDAHADGRSRSRGRDGAALVAMNVPKSIFRQYDVRGLVGTELTPELARGLGRAFASVGVGAARAARRSIAVGRDNRPSGDALAAGVRRGIVEAGGTAVDVGTLPTPALYFAVHALAADGGVQVTGSHNPPEFNGFKMVLGGDAFHGEEILELWEMIVAERWRSGHGPGDQRRLGPGALPRGNRQPPPAGAAGAGGGGLRQRGGEPRRRLHPRGRSAPRSRRSSASPTAPFPTTIPIPPCPRTCATCRPRCGAPGPSSGIAFDGDADRIGAVDETGEIIYGDQLLVILGRDAVRRFGPGTPVIFDVKCSEVLPAALARGRRASRSCGRPGTR